MEWAPTGDVGGADGRNLVRWVEADRLKSVGTPGEAQIVQWNRCGGHAPLKVIWLLLTAFFVVMLVVMTAQPILLWRAGSRTDGVIVELHPEIHRSAIVEYTVEGRSYHVSGLPERSSPQSGQVGGVQDVYYLPNRPGVACIGAPGKLFMSLAWLFPVAELLMTLVVLSQAWERRRRSAVHK